MTHGCNFGILATKWLPILKLDIKWLFGTHGISQEVRDEMWSAASGATFHCKRKSDVWCYRPLEVEMETVIPIQTVPQAHKLLQVPAMFHTFMPDS